MGKINVIKVSTKKDLDAFIKFPLDLYAGNGQFVPEMANDVRDSFNPEKNHGLSFTEVQAFIAERDGEVVGRIAGIINTRANKKWNASVVRFGYIDFIDDTEVSKALLDTVVEWGRERGMTEIQGPLGITDFDKEGMLVEDFDRLGSMIDIYNYPYYPKHMEARLFQDTGLVADKGGGAEGGSSEICPCGQAERLYVWSEGAQNNVAGGLQWRGAQGIRTDEPGLRPIVRIQFLHPKSD